MYSYEDRIRAVELYIKYDHSVSAVRHELGYPTKTMLLRWYKEYLENGDLIRESKKKPKYSEEQKSHALEYYLTHGRCIAQTARTLGYPSRQRLQEWVDEAFPERKKRCMSGNYLVKCAQEQKERAVIDLCTRTVPAIEIADKYGVTRQAVYKWKTQLLGEGDAVSMPKNNKSDNNDSIDDLLAERETLKKQVSALSRDVYRLQMERDVLEKASEVLKKGRGISLEAMTNREKAIVIDALRKKYRLNELLSLLCIAKSSYCYQMSALRSGDKYTELRLVVEDAFNEARGCYGYRRIHRQLQKLDFVVSEKVVRRIMKEDRLTVPCVKKKKYCSYVGEITPAVENIVNRDFHAENPNTKWLTDITEFHISAGKVYLSPIIDCFDGLVVSWTIGTSPSADLANSMLDEAISGLQAHEHPIVHSDRGGHYRWPGWIERMNKAKLVRSMSKKGCSPDNAACEGFFGRLKNEMFYGRSWLGVSLEQFMDALDSYIHWYNEKRIKLSIGSMSPIDYRRSLGLIA